MEYGFCQFWFSFFFVRNFRISFSIASGPAKTAISHKMRPFSKYFHQCMDPIRKLLIQRPPKDNDQHLEYLQKCNKRKCLKPKIHKIQENKTFQKIIFLLQRGSKSHIDRGGITQSFDQIGQLKSVAGSSTCYFVNVGVVLQNYIIQFSTSMILEKLQCSLASHKRHILLIISVLAILAHALFILSSPFLQKQHPLFLSFSSNSKHLVSTNGSSQLQWIIYSALFICLLALSNFFAVSPLGRLSKWTHLVMLILSILLFVSCWALFMSMNTVIQTAQKLTLPESFPICSILSLEVKGDSFLFMKHMKITMIVGLFADIIASCSILAFWKENLEILLKENFERKVQMQRIRANHLFQQGHSQH